MKNVGLGLVVFSLPSKFLWALGRGDGISALPPQGEAEARVGTPGFCSPFPPPRNLGVGLQFLQVLKRGDFGLRAE